MSSLFYKDIAELWGVGTARAKLFRKLGVDSVGALIEYYPRSYIDFTNPVKINEASTNKECCIRAKVISDFSTRKVRNNLTIYKCDVSDGSSDMTITLFNNRYAPMLLKKGEEYFFIGKLNPNSSFRKMTSPVFEAVSNNINLKPVYRQTEGLSSKIIERAVKAAFKLLPEHLNDCFPSWIIDKYKLCDLKYAINNIHFPSSYKNLELARKRISFEKLLVFYMSLLLLKVSNRGANNFKISTNYKNEFLKLLNFELTSSQQKVIDECLKDMSSSEFCMNRLIQGDVGCGKTVVAAALCYSVIKNNRQVAFMAPTEILSNQHYEYFSKLFSDSGIRVAVLTSSVKPKNRRMLLDQLRCGLIDLIIGTQSLLSDEVEFSNLGLVITDEQHRFGVNQRIKLKDKADNPHLLVMSATPIPRTMALVIHGDLDVSTIDELPSGRKEIKTYWIKEDKRDRAFSFIKKQLDNNRQAYIVCAAIEDSEIESLKSIESYKKLLDNSILKDYRIEILHGKLSDYEKQSLMLRFANGEIDILLATSVIEVGIDVANANLILIENAERFGLSAIHQLRGRVGRGEYESYCILVSNADNPEAQYRLNAICNTTDGFKISNEDLKLRGPGDFFGTRQHGIIDDIFADDLEDAKMFAEVIEAAKEILDKDPELTDPENRLLKFRVGTKLANTLDN